MNILGNIKNTKKCVDIFYPSKKYAKSVAFQLYNRGPDTSQKTLFDLSIISHPKHFPHFTDHQRHLPESVTGFLHQNMTLIKSVAKI